MWFRPIMRLGSGEEGIKWSFTLRSSKVHSALIYVHQTIYPPIRNYTETLHTYTFYYFLFVLVLELPLCQSVNHLHEIFFINMVIIIKICNKYCWENVDIWNVKSSQFLILHHIPWSYIAIFLNASNPHITVIWSIQHSDKLISTMLKAQII
jgi:hypothetical protein